LGVGGTAGGGVIITGVHVDCRGGDMPGNGVEILTGGMQISRLRVSGGNFGLFSFAFGDVELDQIAIDGSAQGIGIWGMGPADAISIRRASISGTTQLGLYIFGTNGAVVLESFVGEQLARSGVALGLAPSVTLRDVLVRDVANTDAADSHGIAFSGTTNPSIERARVERVHGAGIAAAARTTLTARSVLVQDIDEQECDPMFCPSPGGSGIVAGTGSTVTVADFAVRRAALCGLHAGPDSQIDASTGEVAESTIGACVGGEDYDLGRLMDGIRYRDNTTNLDSRGLPPPEVTLPML